MGLFDMNKAGGLFGGIYKERPGYQTPGIGDGIDPDTQDAINTYAAMPAKQGKGGFLGSGYDGEDIMSMLLRAAAIAQGDYASGAAFGENIGARARAAAAEAAKRQQEREDYVWKKETDQRYAGPPEPTTMYRQYKEAGYSDAEIQDLMRRDLRAGRMKTVPVVPGGTVMGSVDGEPFTPLVVANPGDRTTGAPAGSGVVPFQDTATGKTYYRVGNRVFDNEAEARAAGGGVSNDPGNFPPRKY